MRSIVSSERFHLPSPNRRRDRKSNNIKRLALAVRAVAAVGVAAGTAAQMIGLRKNHGRAFEIELTGARPPVFRLGGLRVVGVGRCVAQENNSRDAEAGAGRAGTASLRRMSAMERVRLG